MMEAQYLINIKGMLIYLFGSDTKCSELAGRVLVFCLNAKTGTKNNCH